MRVRVNAVLLPGAAEDVDKANELPCASSDVAKNAWMTQAGRERSSEFKSTSLSFEIGSIELAIRLPMTAVETAGLEWTCEREYFAFTA